MCPLSVVAEDVPERSQIADQYKWDLTDMYRDASAWEDDKAKLIALLPSIADYRGKLGNDGSTLLAAIEAIQAVETIVANLYVYAGLKNFEDTRISENGARFFRGARSLFSVSTGLGFFLSGALIHTRGHTRSLCGYDAPASRSTSTTSMKRHACVLTPCQRKRKSYWQWPQIHSVSLIASSRPSTALIYSLVALSMRQASRSSSPPHGTAPFLHSTDRQVRKDAWTQLFEGYQTLNHTLAANYEGHVKSRVFFARARGFDSRLQQATYTNAIPIEVFNNLITAVRAGSGPLQRYLKLRESALGVDRLEIWDMYAPIVEPSLANISFDEAKNIVAEALTPLGDEYLDIYWKGFDEGWVDALANRGKRGGAYSWGTYTSKPYLSMNFEGTLNNVSTLAHEYGHSIHSYLTRNTQPQVYGDYRTFIAEIASMTNEAILMQKMLTEASSAAERAYLLSSYLDEFRGGFYRQASFADFEARAHAKVEAGEALTADVLNALYADVFSDYYGDAVHTDDLNQIEWSRIPHFLRSDNFYVYQYSTSFVAATALAKQILEEGEPARKRYLAMLKSGSNDYPIELLKKAGVDMTTAEPIKATVAVFDDLVGQLEQALRDMEATSAIKP